jgi:hypothetical protein
VKSERSYKYAITLKFTVFSPKQKTVNRRFARELTISPQLTGFFLAPSVYTGAVEQSDRQAIFDEFGELFEESKRWAAKAPRFEVVKDIIRDLYPDSLLAPDATDKGVGLKYEVKIGQRPIQKTWTSMRTVYLAAGGLKAFLKICDVTFKALSDVLGNAKAEALQTEARTGKRKLTAVARVAPIAAELPKAA